MKSKFCLLPNKSQINYANYLFRQYGKKTALSYLAIATNPVCPTISRHGNSMETQLSPTQKAFLERMAKSNSLDYSFPDSICDLSVKTTKALIEKGILEEIEPALFKFTPRGKALALKIYSLQV